jgi:GNAT superfamily N-acetyltransferase
MGALVNPVEQQQVGQLTYGFETDENYLRQYASLVNQFYKKDLDLDLAENHMEGGLEQAMPGEYFYLVRDGERVIGGAKISFASTASTTSLPMEEGEFTVRGYLPKDFGEQGYAEIGRLVVDPGYRGKEILHTMVAELATFASHQGAGYLFVLAPALNAVLYRRICRSLGMPIEQHKDANLPDKPLYRRLDIKLLSSDIRGFVHESVAMDRYDIAV